VVDGDVPAIVVAPRTGDVDGVVVAAAVAVVSIGARVDPVAVGLPGAACCRDDAAIGRPDFADSELFRAVAAEVARDRDAIADAERVLGPANAAQVRDVARLQLPVFGRAVGILHGQPIANMRVGEPDLRDRARELTLARGIELGGDRVMRLDRRDLQEHPT
jgi:hypothetical protein